MAEQPTEQIFGRAWRLLVANPVLLVPGAIVGIACGAAAGALAPLPPTIDPSDPTSLSTVDYGSRLLGTVLIYGATVVATILTNAFTIGPAGTAWMRGTVSLADGVAALRTSGARLVVSMVLFGVLDAILAVFGFGLGALLFQYFALYLFAAVVIGHDPFGQALKLSFMLATRRFVPTLLIVVTIFALAFVASLMAASIHAPRGLLALLATLVIQLLVSYANLVIAGQYLEARNAPDVVPAH